MQYSINDVKIHILKIQRKLTEDWKSRIILFVLYSVNFVKVLFAKIFWARGEHHDSPESIDWRAIGYLERDILQRPIANFFDLSQSVTCWLLNQFRITGDVHRRSGQGLSRVTIPSENLYLSIRACWNRRRNATYT